MHTPICIVFVRIYSDQIANAMVRFFAVQKMPSQRFCLHVLRSFFSFFFYFRRFLGIFLIFFLSSISFNENKRSVARELVSCAWGYGHAGVLRAFSIIAYIFLRGECEWFPCIIIYFEQKTIKHSVLFALLKYGIWQNLWLALDEWNTTHTKLSTNMRKAMCVCQKNPSMNKDFIKIIRTMSSTGYTVLIMIGRRIRVQQYALCDCGIQSW